MVFKTFFGVFYPDVFWVAWFPNLTWAHIFNSGWQQNHQLEKLAYSPTNNNIAGWKITNFEWEIYLHLWACRMCFPGGGFWTLLLRSAPSIWRNMIQSSRIPARSTSSVGIFFWSSQLAPIKPIWAMKKKEPWLFRIHVGDEILSSYIRGLFQKSWHEDH